MVYHVLLAVFLFRGVDGALEFASSDSRFPVMQQFKHANYFQFNAITMNMLCICYRKLRVQGMQMVDMLFFINIFYLDQVP